MDVARGRGTGGDRFHVLNRSDEALTWRLRAIDSATASIDLQTFLWKPDTAGLAILSRVLAAADRGVRVRILLDDSFTVGEGDVIGAIAQHPNIEFRIYNPFAQRPDSLALRQVANLGDFARIDHRMHNKVMITDARAAIVGGRNLADEYFGMHPTANFRDLELLALGPIIGQLSQLFDRYWRSPWSIPASAVVGAPAPGKGLDRLRTQLVERAQAGPAESADARLAAWTALAAGAIPGGATVLADEPAQVDPARETPNQLASALIEQVDDKHLGLHAKAVLFDDDLSFVGSANLDPRSLKINTEMGLLVRSRELSRQLRDALGIDFDTRNAWHLEAAAGGNLKWVGGRPGAERAAGGVAIAAPRGLVLQRPADPRQDVSTRARGAGPAILRTGCRRRTRRVRTTTAPAHRRPAPPARRAVARRATRCPCRRRPRASRASASRWR